MDLQSVRTAYSAMSEQYIAMVGDGSLEHEADVDLVRRHLSGLTGPVLDLGCGPGHWTSYLHSVGADVTGVDMVPEFVTHARATYPGLAFQQSSMTELDLPDGSVAGILSWYSTIHLTPSALDDVLAEFRRLLAPSGVLVLGFFDSDDTVAEFDHKVVAAHRWPTAVLSARLANAGLTEVERLGRQVPRDPIGCTPPSPRERPDRKEHGPTPHPGALRTRASVASRACRSSLRTWG